MPEEYDKPVMEDDGHVFRLPEILINGVFLPEPYPMPKRHGFLKAIRHTVIP